MPTRLVMVWGAEKDVVLARTEQILGGVEGKKVYRKDVFDVVHAEDLDRKRSMTSKDNAFAVVVEFEE